MNTVLIILSIVCVLIGIVGSIVPGIPGPPISWLALLLLYWSSRAAYGVTLLIVFAVIAAIITVLDYVVPVWGTKRLGGTKAGTRGSTWGLVISVFVLPLLGITLGPFGLIGILGGPFVGAYVGEKWHGNAANAWRAAWGSFLGFMAGTLIKLTYGIVVAVYVIKGLIVG